MRTLVAAAFLALLCTAAAADPEAKPATPAGTYKTSDCARARAQHKTCELTIDPETIAGEKPTGSGTTIGIVDWGKAGSLIRIRRDFLPEIVRSAEDL